MADLQTIDYQLQIMALLAEGNRRKLGPGRWVTISGARCFLPSNSKEPVIAPAWLKWKLEKARGTRSK